MIATTATDATGLFTFEVSPGAYIIAQLENLPPYIDVSDSDGDHPNLIEVDVTIADSVGNDFVDRVSTVCPVGTVEFRPPTEEEMVAEINARMAGPLYPDVPAGIVVLVLTEFGPEMGKLDSFP